MNILKVSNMLIQHHKLNRIIILSFIIAFTSCKKDEPEKIVQSLPEKTAQIESEYNCNIYWQRNENYTPVAYRGDTIAYKVFFSSNTKVKYIAVYYLTDAGIKYEMPSYDWEDSFKDNIIWIDKNKDSLTYYYPLADIRYEYSPFNSLMSNSGCQSQLTSLVFEYHDSLDVIHIDTLPEFELKNIDAYNHQRLYNIASGKDYFYKRAYSFGYHMLKSHSFVDNINCGGPCIYPDDTSLFMINIPNDDYNYDLDSAITKDFIVGWQAPKGNHNFVKVEKGVSYFANEFYSKVRFDYINSTFQLKQIYDENEPKVTRVESPEVGDLYAFHYIHASYPTADSKYLDVYGLIEVTHIENDMLTSENGGNDLDYIEFRLKSYCNAFRYK